METTTLVMGALVLMLTAAALGVGLKKIFSRTQTDTQVAAATVPAPPAEPPQEPQGQPSS